MARKKINNPDSWSLREGFGAFAPWSGSYHSMRARNARTGVRFILPFIIGFCVFMVMPLIQSMEFSLNNVTLVPGKGYDLLIQVAGKVLPSHPDWKWLICGDGPEREMLEEFRDREGLREQFILCGLVPRVEDYLGKAKSCEESDYSTN